MPFRRLRPRTVLALSLLLQAVPVHAEESIAPRNGVSLAGGQGALGQRHDSWRVGLQRHWASRWWRHEHWHFTGYWDVGLTLWDASDEVPGPDDRGAARIYALGAGPVLRWQWEPIGAWHIAPFAELGVGLALLTDRSLRSGKVRSLPLGSYWQFEDRGTIGLRLGREGRFEIAYQRMHHSNLNLASANHGVDSHLLLLGVRF